MPQLLRQIIPESELQLAVEQPRRHCLLFPVDELTILLHQEDQQRLLVKVLGHECSLHLIEQDNKIEHTLLKVFQGIHYLLIRIDK